MMMIKTLIRGLMPLVSVVLFGASSYGASLALGNVATSDSSGVFIIPGMAPNLQVANPGNPLIPTASYDYTVGSEGFFLMHGNPNPPAPKKEGVGGLVSVGAPGPSGSSGGGGSSTFSLVPPPAGGDSGSLIAETPEPSALLLLSAGLAALASCGRRKLQLVQKPRESHYPSR